MKCKDYSDHNKNLKVAVKGNSANLATTVTYLDFVRLHPRYLKDNYEEALFYRGSTEDEVDDLKVYKISSVVLVHSGAAFTSINNSMYELNIPYFNTVRVP